MGRREEQIRRMFSIALAGIERAALELKQSREMIERIYEELPDDEYMKFVDEIREMEKKLRRLGEKVEAERDFIM